MTFDTADALENILLAQVGDLARMHDAAGLWFAFVPSGGVMFANTLKSYVERWNNDTRG